MPKRVACLVVVTAVLAVTACSGSSDDVESPSSVTATIARRTLATSTTSGSQRSQGASPSTPGRRTRTPPVSPSPTDESEDGVAWVPYGPAAIETPGDEAQYYARLQQKSCDFDPQGTVGDAYHIYRGAARACLALQGDTAAWDAASEDLAAIRLAGGTGCLERAAYSFLKQAVLAHQRAPRARLRTRNATRASACTPAISRTRVLLTEGAATGITVEGDALWDVTKATIDGRAAQVSDKMPSYITIKPLQPLEPGSTVTIVINQGPLPPLTTRVRIPRSDSASPSPSPIPADTPSP